MARLNHDGGRSYRKDLLLSGGKLTYDVEIARMTQIDEDEWNELLMRGKLPEGYARINGVPYAFGEAAKRRGGRYVPKGADRYLGDYQAQTIYAADKLLKRSSEIKLRCTFPPIDAQYIKHMIAGFKGDFEVESRYGLHTYRVTGLTVIDEPIAQYSRYVLTADGTERKHNKLADKTFLVLDLGGYTYDSVAVDPKGKIDMSTVASTQGDNGVTGAIAVMRHFQDRLKYQFEAEFMGAGDLPDARLEEAIRTGFYRFGKSRLDCNRIARDARNAIADEVNEVIRAQGGAQSFQAALIGGGSGAMALNEIIERNPRLEIVTVAKPDEMQSAGAYGAYWSSLLLRKARREDAS